MNKKTAFIILIILLFAVVFTGKYHPYTTNGRWSDITPGVALAMQNVSMVGSDENGKLWSMKARNVELTKDRSTLVISRIHDGKVYLKDDSGFSFESGKAVYDIWTKNLNMYKGIKLQSDNGQKVSGTSVFWNSSSHMLTSQEPVKYENEWGIVSARRIALNTQEKQVNLYNASVSQKKSEDAFGSADVIKIIEGSKKVYILKGNVKFTHGDTTVITDYAEYDKQTKIAVSPGKIKVFNPESDITANKGTMYFNKKIGLLEGDVVMLVKPTSESSVEKKDSLRESLKDSTTVTCAKMEYNYKTKVAAASGNVIFKQPKRQLTASGAEYDLKNELLKLKGPVKGVDEDGQTFTSAGQVTISLKKGDEWMEAPNATATFKIDVE